MYRFSVPIIDIRQYIYIFLQVWISGLEKLYINTNVMFYCLLSVLRYLDSLIWKFEKHYRMYLDIKY